MSTKKLVNNNQLNITQLTRESAFTVVTQCIQAPLDSLWKVLTTYISQLKTASQFSTVDDLESFTYVVYKGFQRKSEEANALRYFYCGYFAREQEEVVRIALSDQKKRNTTMVASLKHSFSIMRYLFDNGCSQQKQIAKILGIDKSNLSRNLTMLISCGLVNKVAGPKYAFYELTQDGYSYYRQHNSAHQTSADSLKQSARLQSEAFQIRDELFRLEPCKLSYHPVTTSRSQERIPFVITYSTISQWVSTPRVDYNTRNPNNLTKESKYMMNDYVVL